MKLPNGLILLLLSIDSMFAGVIYCALKEASILLKAMEYSLFMLIKLNYK